MNKTEILEIISDYNLNEDFTIEQLIRDIRKSLGEKYEGVFEIQGQLILEKYLLEEGIIKQTGSTKTYKRVNQINQ